MSSDGGKYSHVWGPNAVDCEEKRQKVILQTQKKNTETLAASSDWLINRQLCIGGYVVDYYPVKAAVTETQQGVIKIPHGLK